MHNLLKCGVIFFFLAIAFVIDHENLHAKDCIALGGTPAISYLTPAALNNLWLAQTDCNGLVQDKIQLWSEDAEKLDNQWQWLKNGIILGGLTFVLWLYAKNKD